MGETLRWVQLWKEGKVRVWPAVYWLAAKEGVTVKRSGVNDTLWSADAETVQELHKSGEIDMTRFAGSLMEFLQRSGMGPYHRGPNPPKLRNSGPCSDCGSPLPASGDCGICGSNQDNFDPHMTEHGIAGEKPWRFEIEYRDKFEEEVAEEDLAGLKKEGIEAKLVRGDDKILRLFVRDNKRHMLGNPSYPYMKGGRVRQTLDSEARTARLHPQGPHKVPYARPSRECHCGGVPTPASSEAVSDFKRRVKKILGNPSTQGLTIVGACCILIETTQGRVTGKMGRVVGLPDGSVLIEGNFPKVPGGTVKRIEYMDDAKARAEGEMERGVPWRHDMESERIALERTQGGLLMRRKGKPLWEML